jgi:competence protein ComEC
MNFASGVVIFAIIMLIVALQSIGWERITEFLRLNPASTFVSRPAEGVVQVHYLDVGQGNAALILSESRSVLIDSGDASYRNMVIDYVRRMGVERLCLIIATHPHADHIGGMDEIIERIGADRIMLPKIAEQFLPDTATYGRKLYAIEENDVVPFYATVGYVFPLDDVGSAFIEVLGPAGCFGDSLNDHSIIVRLIHGDSSFLFTGDVERAGEQCLLERGVDLSANVVKVSHHGSRTSSGRAFLESVFIDCPVTINYAVISVGSGNRHGHPTSDVLNRLEVLGFHVYRTDLHGHIVFVSSPDGLEIVYRE